MAKSVATVSTPHATNHPTSTPVQQQTYQETQSNSNGDAVAQNLLNGMGTQIEQDNMDASFPALYLAPDGEAPFNMVSF